MTRKIFMAFKTNDKEAIALGGLSFTIIAVDIFDSAATFINAFLPTISLLPIVTLAATGLPLGFIISGLGTVSRTIQIAKALNLYPKSEGDATKELKSKIILEALGILANLIILTSLTLLALGNVSQLPFLMIALGFIIKLGGTLYQDHALRKR